MALLLKGSYKPSDLLCMKSMWNVVPTFIISLIPLLHYTTLHYTITLLPTCYEALCRALRTQDRMPLEQENLFLCVPPQELTDLEIFAPSNTRITFKIAKCDMS